MVGKSAEVMVLQNIKKLEKDKYRCGKHLGAPTLIGRPMTIQYSFG
jgi:hypothetical protein